MSQSTQQYKPETEHHSIDDVELDHVYQPSKHESHHDDEIATVSEEQAPDLSWPSIRHYAVTRFTSLFELHLQNIKDLNPIPALREMTPNNWNYFFLGMLSWFSASFDFFLTAVCGTQIAASLNVSTADITWGLSAVLMVRSAGAVLFGLWTDNYSRKWPYIFCAGMFCVLQIATGFVKSYEAFLAVRSLSGVAMGGTYACSAATSLEDAPLKARSFLSGLFFTAYGFGFIFAAVFWKAFSETEKTWKSLFWFSAGIPFVLILWRLIFPETTYFTRVLKAKELIKADQIAAGTYVKPTFKSKMSNVLKLSKKYWLMFIYLVLLLAGANYLTHASQDLYPTMLRKQLGYSEDRITVTIVVTNLGGVVGAMVIGSLVEVLGRRNALILCAVAGGAFCYPAYMVQTQGSMLGGGFFLFFFVLGTWGVIPAHLSELSPPDARALVSGLAYQLGNLASSASSTIETRLANQWPLAFDSNGVATKYNYAKVMTVLTGSVFIYMLGAIFIGPEKFHRDLSSPVMKKYINKVIEMEQDGENNAHYSSGSNSDEQESKNEHST